MIFGGPGIEHIAFASPASENLVLSWSWDIRCIFIGLGSKYVDFRGPGTNKKIAFWWSRDRKYQFLVLLE